MNDIKFSSALKRLNPRQLEAVESIEGPVAVIAGPGTGKTQILALRIGNILRKTQVDPYNVLALTFTDMGVVAMRERLVKLIGPTGYDVQVFTFHSFCSKVIEEFPEKFTFKKELRAIDDITKYELLRSILDEKNFEYLSTLSNKYFNVRKIASDIDSLKKEAVSSDQLRVYLVEKFREHQEAIPPEKITKTWQNNYNKTHKSLRALEELVIVYDRFNHLMTEKGFYDFNDMILFVLNKFKEDSDLLLHYQEIFHYLLADEFQDSNSSQVQILDLLASYHIESPNLFIVGDDDQSIYKFQGASLTNFNNFFEKYPTTKRIVLNENYRSTQTILDASKSVITNNQSRLEPNKSLNSNAEYAEEKITLLKYNSEVEESIGVVKKIKELISSGVSPLEIAVLARNNKQLANIAEYFEDNEIPFSLSVSKNVLENPYTKKVISILKVLDDPSNFVELNKVFFLPNLKISVKEILAFNDYVKSNNLKNCFEVPYSEGKGEISALLRMLDKWYKSSELLSVPELIIEIITDIKLIEYLVLKLEKIEDFESLNSFIDFAKASHVNGRANSVAEILNTLDSMLADNLSPRAKEILPSAESVQLMSAHKSKGLEFDYVFMIATINSKWTGGAKHNSFIPKGLLSPMYDSKKDEEEESRRLFYVGLTRAKKSVFLTYASDYTATTSEQIAAKFITEIDENLISVETVSPISHKELAETILKKPAEDYSFYKEKNKIQELVKNFKLSATSLNNFLGCRKRFFLQNILRIPQSTGPKLIIGNAVHVLAEKFIDKFDVKKEELVEAISMYISRQNCSDKDKKYFLEKSIEFYVNWTTAMREDNITINPLFREYKFEAKNIIFEGVPLTGKIDVVELLNEDAKEVRVYDYKTTKPKRENEIKGLNKGSNANYYNQLMFYKLMSESVPNFKYKVVQGAIAFIEPDANNEYKTVNINFNDQDYAEFKETVTTVYEQIQNLEFLDFTEECTCLNCEYNYL